MEAVRSPFFAKYSRLLHEKQTLSRYNNTRNKERPSELGPLLLDAHVFYLSRMFQLRLLP